MKKTIFVFLIVVGLINPTPFSFGASKITSGSTCKQENQQAVYKNKIFTCIKLGKKLYWDNGRSYVLNPTPTASAIVSATPTPAQAISPKPTTQPTPSPSKSVPLLRISDFTFVSGKLKVVWSGLDSSQQQLTNVRKINVWVFDLQSEQSLAGGVWRVACYIAPTPGSFCEISLPPRDHAVRITASYLNGEESSWSTTLRAKASPVVSTLPTDVEAGWG